MLYCRRRCGVGGIGGTIFGNHNLIMCLLSSWGGGILISCCHWAPMDFHMSDLHPVQCKLPG